VCYDPIAFELSQRLGAITVWVCIRIFEVIFFPHKVPAEKEKKENEERSPPSGMIGEGKEGRGGKGRLAFGFKRVTVQMKPRPHFGMEEFYLEQWTKV